MLAIQCRLAYKIPHYLFVPEALYRVQPRGLSCRQNTEDEAHADRDREPCDNGPKRNLSRQARYQQYYQVADPDRRYDTDDTAEKGERHCLEQKLHHDSALGC